jgi:hypothetical protein
LSTFTDALLEECHLGVNAVLPVFEDDLLSRLATPTKLDDNRPDSRPSAIFKNPSPKLVTILTVAHNSKAMLAEVITVNLSHNLALDVINGVLMSSCHDDFSNAPGSFWQALELDGILIGSCLLFKLAPNPSNRSLPIANNQKRTNNQLTNQSMNQSIN